MANFSQEHAACEVEMKMQLCLLEEIFKEEQSVAFAKINQERADYEEEMKMRLSDNEEIQENWMVVISQLQGFIMQLEEKVEEREMARLELEEASKQNIQSLSTGIPVIAPLTPILTLMAPGSPLWSSH